MQNNLDCFVMQVGAAGGVGRFSGHPRRPEQEPQRGLLQLVEQGAQAPLHRHLLHLRARLRSSHQSNFALCHLPNPSEHHSVLQLLHQQQLNNRRREQHAVCGDAHWLLRRGHDSG